MKDTVIEYTGPCEVHTLLDVSYSLGEIYADPHPDPKFGGRKFAVISSNGDVTDEEHDAAVQHCLAENTVYAKQLPLEEQAEILRSLRTGPPFPRKARRGRPPKQTAEAR